MGSILNQTKQPKFKFLDGLRGIAAIYVMIGHARWLLWEGYQGYNDHPEKYTVIDKALMYFFSFFKWGHEFVLLFFVLSGFVIHYGYCLKLKNNPHASIDIRQYFFRRAKRIYPPFLLALFITFLLDLIGTANGLSIYWGTSIYPLINENVGNTSHSLKTFIGNVLFLYKEYVPIFGTNGPTWSLKFEWWFYMLYPIFLFFSRRHIYYSSAAILVLFIASFFSTFWPNGLLREIFASMLCWWLGVILAEVAAKRIEVKMQGFAICSIVIFIIMLFFHKSDVLYDLQIALFFAFVISIFLILNERNISLKFLERLKPFGDFSYTLYIIHFPILVLLSGLIMKYYGNSLPVHSYFIITGIIFCLAIAYTLHFIVEVPFTKKSQQTAIEKTQQIERPINESVGNN